MERVRDELCHGGPGITHRAMDGQIRIYLCTSDYHIERAGLIFQRAAEAILAPAGIHWNIELASCQTDPDNSEVNDPEKGHLESAQRNFEYQRTHHNHSTDEDVRKKWK